MARKTLMTVDSRNYGALRIFFGALAFGTLFYLSQKSTFYYSGEGWFPLSAYVNLKNPYLWSVLKYFESPLSVHIFFVFILLASLAMTVGWWSKTSTVITFIGFVSIYNRNPAVVYGGDSVLRVILFYLCFAPVGKAWSIDAYKIGEKRAPLQPAWPLILIRFQVCIIYFVMGLTKLHGTFWIDGQALSLILANSTYARFNFYFLRSVPGMEFFLKICTWLILAWELLFPALILSRRTRGPALGIGVFINVAIILFLKMHWFGYLMIASYISFLPPSFFDLIEKWHTSAHRRLGIPLLVDYRSEPKTSE